jgi:hypothetical protein
MARVRIVSPTDAIADGEPRPAGWSRSVAVFDQESDPLHMWIHSLGSNSEREIRGDSTDAVAYVWKGAATAGATTLAERASLIVERNASVTLTGAAQGATILVFNLSGLPGRARAGGHVHLLPSERVPRTLDMGGSGVAGGALHADAACPTCEIWLHENDFYQSGYEVAVHSHTEDEIIFVRAGGIRLGNRLYGPGTTLAIRANTKYGFRAGPDGLSFVNFRATSPCHVSADGSHIMDEAELWRTHVGAPQYLDLTVACRQAAQERHA